MSGFHDWVVARANLQGYWQPLATDVSTVTDSSGNSLPLTVGSGGTIQGSTSIVNGIAASGHVDGTLPNLLLEQLLLALP